MSLSGMRLRVLSAVVLAAPALLTVYIGPPAFDIVFGLVALVMVLEWDSLCGGERKDVATWVLGTSVLVAIALCLADRHSAALWSTPAGFAALYAVARGIDRKAPLLEACGALYIGIPIVALLWLRNDPAYGMVTVFWLLAVVWATDTGALFVGRAVGGPKLAPSISPNKTWSGFFGGIAAAIVVSMVAALWYGAPVAPVLLAGAVLSIVSQLGDLLESRVKRYLNVKDSGGIIPGHGGLFDRVDGLLAAAPALAIVYVVAGGGSVLWP
jgi:phosphatidate cytidylyltransferase